MLKAIAISAAILAATPSLAQEVRVLSGGIEHIYGRGGQILDSPELRAKNRRVERQVREEQRTREELDQRSPQGWSVQNWWCRDNSCQQPPKSAWSDPNTPREPPRSAWSNPGNQQPPTKVGGRCVEDASFATGLLGTARSDRAKCYLDAFAGIFSQPTSDQDFPLAPTRALRKV